MAFNSRQVLIGVAAVVVVAAAAVYFFTQHRNGAVLEGTSANPPAADAAAPPVAPAGELMQPGPLGEMTLGDPNAPHTIIEYASLTCPHCQNFYTQVFGQLKAKYIDTGKAYFIFREFPRDPLDTAAFMLARCAPKESYFPMIDLLFQRQSQWAFVPDPKTALFNAVKQSGYTQASFDACLTNQQILDGVTAVGNRAAKEFGVTGTPAFFIDGTEHAGELSIAEIDEMFGS